MPKLLLLSVSVICLSTTAVTQHGGLKVLCLHMKKVPRAPEIAKQIPTTGPCL